MNFGSVMASGPADAPEHDIRDQAAAHTLAANPLVGVRGQDIFESAQLLLAETLGNPALAVRQYVTLLAEIGRQRACARSQGSALCRSGVERESGLSRARAELHRLGERASPFSGRCQHR